MIFEVASCIIIFCCSIDFVSSADIVNIFFCLHSLYFPKLLSAACDIMVLIFPHSKRILLLPGISRSFYWILCLYGHRILSSWSSLILQWSIFSLRAVFLGKCEHFLAHLNLAKPKSDVNQCHFFCKLSRPGIDPIVSCLHWKSLQLFWNCKLTLCTYRDRGSTVVKVLCYKSEGGWNFSLT